MEEQGEALLEKIQRAFSGSEGSAIYGREKERERILEFIHGQRGILHVAGNPGTGKTSILMSLLKNENHAYYNYFYEPDLVQKLKASKQPIIVIDEFDRFHKERRTECRKVMAILSRRNTRIITVSNTRQIKSLVFNPYTFEDMLKILKSKVEKEIGSEVASEAALRMLVKRFGRDGDMRIVMKEMLILLMSKGDRPYLGLEDVVPKGTLEKQGSVHHELLAKAATSAKSFLEAYRAYLKDCKVHSVPCLGRNEVKRIYDLARL